MMHPCVACDGTGKVNFYISYEDPHHDGYYISDGELHNCLECSGTGELEGCQCSARNPYECMCGAWDDVDLDEWIDD